MVDFKEIEELITSNLPDAKMQIQDLTGGKDHLGMMVISDQFEGKMLIEQHQIVMDILKEKLKGDLHALQLKTMTKAQAIERFGQLPE